MTILNLLIVGMTIFFMLLFGLAITITIVSFLKYVWKIRWFIIEVSSDPKHVEHVMTSTASDKDSRETVQTTYNNLLKTIDGYGIQYRNLSEQLKSCGNQMSGMQNRSHEKKLELEDKRKDVQDQTNLAIMACISRINWWVTWSFRIRRLAALAIIILFLINNVAMCNYHYFPDVQTNYKPKVTCLHCNKTGGISTMKRWHFDQCKHNQSK